METSLHRQLKLLYAKDGAPQEVPLGEFRIDVVVGDELVEIQHGGLAAIRDKVAKLVRSHSVRVVKPIVVRKQLVKLDRPGGRVVGRRASPKQGSALDLFHELVYFTRVFPHPNLVLDTPLIAVEEWRCPGHGRRRRWRRNDHVVEDQRLTEVVGLHTYRSAADLWRLLPANLPRPFHSGHLAEQLDVARWIAQRIVYCLRQTGAAEEDGKQGNARLYRRSA